MGKSHHTLLCGHLSTILFKYISRRGVGYKATTLQLPTPLCTSPSLQGQACLPPIKKKLQPLLQTRGHPLNPSGHLGVQEPTDSHTYLHIHLGESSTTFRSYLCPKEKKLKELLPGLQSRDHCDLVSWILVSPPN